MDGSGAFNCTRAIAGAALTLACACVNAADWRYSVGIHDFVVNAVDSDTYGFTASASADERTETGRHWFGAVDLSWDHDQDDLDPDHIPIWWQLHFGSDGVLRQLSSGVELGWTADLDTRINTVSSIERQIHVLPALRAAYRGNAVHASAKAGVGYFFLEIDDDAPKERGYVRADLRNTTVAESLATDATIRLGAAWKLAGRVQGWWDGSEWLQVEYAAELHLAADHSADHSEFVLSAEVNEYNLDVYQVAGAPSILPWDEDLLIKLVFITAW